MMPDDDVIVVTRHYGNERARKRETGQPLKETSGIQLLPLCFLFPQTSIFQQFG